MSFSFRNDKKAYRRFPANAPIDSSEPFEEIPSDVNGSYTGVPYDADDDIPVQDADDL